MIRFRVRSFNLLLLKENATHLFLEHAPLFWGMICFIFWSVVIVPGAFRSVTAVTVVTSISIRSAVSLFRC